MNLNKEISWTWIWELRWKWEKFRSYFHDITEVLAADIGMWVTNYLMWEVRGEVCCKSAANWAGNHSWRESVIPLMCKYCKALYQERQSPGAWTGSCLSLGSNDDETRANVPLTTTSVCFRCPARGWARRRTRRRGAACTRHPSWGPATTLRYSSTRWGTWGQAASSYSLRFSK